MFRKETITAINAAIKAGTKIIKIYSTNFSTQYKGKNDPITKADIESNNILIKELSQFNYPILSEEMNPNIDRSDKFWIIDPLDGTKEFINRNGEFSVMIALVKGNTPLLGVVYQPTNKTLYVAEKDLGVFKKVNNSWVKLTCSKVSSLKDSKAVLSKSHLYEKDKKYLELMNIKNFIQLGSSGLKVGKICEGKADFYFNPSSKLKIWDTAAATCMISQAGGKITDMFGNNLDYTKDIYHLNGIMVSNNNLHSLLIKKYKEFNSI